MGYAMSIVGEVNDPAEVASTRALFEEAVRMRNAFERGSPEAKQAQGLVDETADAMDAADRGYHRFNVWGMGSVRRIMLDLGMCWNGAQPDYPSPADFGIDAEWCEEADEDGNPWPAGSKQEQYRQAVEAWLGTIGDQPGIPTFKFGSNDGWWVRPGECRSAVAIWRAAVARDDEEMAWHTVFDHISDSESTDEELRAWWQRWIDFLALAADNGGFRVY